jgi:hypothetical protein
MINDKCRRENDEPVRPPSGLRGIRSSFIIYHLSFIISPPFP